MVESPTPQPSLMLPPALIVLLQPSFVLSQPSLMLPPPSLCSICCRYSFLLPTVATSCICTLPPCCWCCWCCCNSCCSSGASLISTITTLPICTLLSCHWCHYRLMLLSAAVDTTADLCSPICHSCSHYSSFVQPHSLLVCAQSSSFDLMCPQYYSLCPFISTAAIPAVVAAAHVCTLALFVLVHACSTLCTLSLWHFVPIHPCLHLLMSFLLQLPLALGLCVPTLYVALPFVAPYCKSNISMF